MRYFKAILLHEFKDYERGAIVEVAAGGDEFAGRWLVLQPVDLAGAWLLPLVDADHAISVVEAAQVLSTRRGHNVPVTTVRRYLDKGTISCAGRVPRGTVGVRSNTPWMMSRDEVWTFKWPKAGRPWWKQPGYEHTKPKEGDDNETQEA